MSKQITFAPFDRMLIKLAYSNEKPRHWYMMDKDGHKNIHYMAFTKIIFKDGLSAYRFTLGPFCLWIGW